MRSQGRAVVSEVLPGPGGTVDADKERVRHHIDNTGLLSQPSFGNDDQFFWGRTVADVGAASVPQVRRYSQYRQVPCPEGHVRSEVQATFGQPATTTLAQFVQFLTPCDAWAGLALKAMLTTNRKIVGA